MLLLSWAYVRFGLASPLVAALLFGFKPAVAALIVRAVQRIGQHALRDRCPMGHRGGGWPGEPAPGPLRGHAGAWRAGVWGNPARWRHAATGPCRAAALALAVPLAAAAAPSIGQLFGYGLRTGLLTFGGAYTAIPLLQHDAVEVGQWMTDAQFVDGLALSGILPAPLIIFATFVGYLGGGPGGAIALTSGVFLPAFLFTILGHGFFERVIGNAAVQVVLDGVTAAVVGLIVVTSAQLVWASLPTTPIEVALAGVCSR